MGWPTDKDIERHRINDAERDIVAMENRMNNPNELLADLVKALDGSFINSWQSTAGWCNELDRAREYVQSLADSQQ